MKHKQIVDFGRTQYAFATVRKGKWLYTATQKLPAQIDWKRLWNRARSAKIEAQ